VARRMAQASFNTFWIDGEIDNSKVGMDYGYAIYERISILLNMTEDGILHGINILR